MTTGEGLQPARAHDAPTPVATPYLVTERQAMTRSGRQTDVVSLSVENWLGIIALILVFAGGGWHFTMQISGRLERVEARVESMEKRMDRSDAAAVDRGRP